jgi:tetratricopeptide (TPR) repeat protein
VVATGVITYQRAAGPPDSWRLAMLPVEAGAGTKELAERLSRDAASQLARLQGGDRARLAVIPLDAVQRQKVDTTEKAGAALGATHVLHATLSKKDDGKLLLRAVLTDLQKRVNGKEWTAEYAPGEMRYAPVALAGMVTSQLGVPPLVAAGSVNSAAAQDYWRGLWYLRRNSTIDAALPPLERAVAEDPDSPLTFAALAEAQQWKWFLGTKEEAWRKRAKEAEREAQRRNPDLAPVHRVAGILNYREGLHELAVTEFSRAIALDPKDAEAHRVLGQAYEATNRLDEALAAYRKAVEVDPGDFRNRQLLANFYYQRADYSEALHHLQKEVDLEPAEPTAHYALGTGYYSLGRLPEAENELRLAIRLGETSQELHSLGVVLIEEQRYQEAAACILRALKVGPEMALWRMNLGTAYRLMNLTAESEKVYRQALELAETQIAKDLRDSKTRSHLAFVCARLGNSTRAASEIEQALRTSPDDASVRFMAAATFEALGRRDDTLRLLTTFSYTELADVNRWPDMADLSHDPRFLKILASRQPK